MPNAHWEKIIKKNNTLPSVVSDYFKKDANELDKNVADRINNLRETIKLANKTIQKENSDILGELVDDAVGFGYPNGEELQIGVNTKLDLESEIINKTELTYSPENIEDILPNTHNGLGYKNLIKMQIQLAQYAAELKEKSKACIPLLFIEEPESHMHPQMQQLFAKYLEDFIKKRTDIPIQIILTTHSPHIANAEEFSKIRYAQKKKHRVIYKDLAKFEEKNKENLEFIRKYLTISRCDLFFADKVIFVEGASERLLIPDMIKKCEKLGLFDREKYKLSAQYYSLIEIGGAYAHKFIPFVEFLRIPCLILTDVDPLKGGKSSTVEAGETSSNSTIKWWCRKIKELNDKDKVSLDDIFSLTNEEKTIGKCHIEFQVKENSICAKSLEEAIMNVNREHYDKKEDAKEEDIEFKGRSKTDFALELIYNNFDYVVPKYIANGLVWLNNEKIFS